MMRNHGSLAAAAVLVACVGFADVASARPRDRHGPPRIDRVLERHAEELGLSDEVREQVRALATSAEEEAKSLREALDAQRETLHRMLAEDAPDPDAVMRQAEAVGAAETELHKQRLRTLLTVRALLTPEQRRELVRIFEEKRRHFGKGFGDGPPPESPRPGAP